MLRSTVALFRFIGECLPGADSHQRACNGVVTVQEENEAQENTWKLFPGREQAH